MLYLIGLGLETKDISLKALEALKKCRKVFAEFYTSPNVYDLEKLEELIGNKIEILERGDIEEKNVVFEAAKKEKVAFLVPGDPLCATTHQNLVFDCKKSGIKYEVIHSASIFTAVCECGLSIYRFGRTVTIARGEFESIYRFIEKNLNADLHTLALLEIDMDAKEAIEILLKMENKFRGKIFEKNRNLVVIERAGTKNSRLIFGKISKLLEFNFSGIPHSIIIPAELDHMEKEFLNMFAEVLDGSRRRNPQRN